MAAPTNTLQHLLDQARTFEPIRVAVADAAQAVLLETLREAHALGFAEPRLIGDPASIAAHCENMGWNVSKDWIVPASTDAATAAKAVELVRAGEADVVMTPLSMWQTRGSIPRCGRTGYPLRWK